MSFRGGLEPSDLGDSFGFPKFKYFSFRVSFGRVGMVEVVGMVGMVGDGRVNPQGCDLYHPEPTNIDSDPAVPIRPI